MEIQFFSVHTLQVLFFFLAWAKRYLLLVIICKNAVFHFFSGGFFFFAPSSFFFLGSPGKKLKLIVVQFSHKKHSIIFKYLVSWKPLIDARPPHPTKHNLHNASNFQGEAHIRIILGKLVTGLATEMCKMTLKLVTLSLPAHPTPTCRNVRLLCVRQSVEWWVHNRSKHSTA